MLVWWPRTWTRRRWSPYQHRALQWGKARQSRDWELCKSSWPQTCFSLVLCFEEQFEENKLCCTKNTILYFGSTFRWLREKLWIWWRLQAGEGGMWDRHQKGGGKSTSTFKVWLVIVHHHIFCERWNTFSCQTSAFLRWGWHRHSLEVALQLLWGIPSRDPGFERFVFMTNVNKGICFTYFRMDFLVVWEGLDADWSKGKV